MRKFYYLFLLLWCFCTGLSAQPWLYDFGTGAGNFSTPNSVNTTLLPLPPTGGGSAQLRIENGGGSWNLSNADFFGIGQGSDLSCIPSSSSVENKFSIQGYAPGKLFHTRFQANFNANTAEYTFLQGKASGFNVSGPVSINDIFTGIRFNVSGGIVTGDHLDNSGNWNNISSLSISTGINTNIEVFGNSRLVPVKFIGPDLNTYILAPGKWMLFVNSSNIGLFDKANTPNGIDINGLCFTGANSPSSLGRLRLDNIQYSNSFSLEPYLQANPLSLVNFGTLAVNTASPSQSFTVLGTGLTGPIVVTPPANFEISLDANSGFSINSITLNPISATVGNTNIFVRYKPTVPGPHLGQNIACTTPGEGTVNVTVSGTANPQSLTIAPGGDIIFGTPIPVGAASAPIARTISGSALSSDVIVDSSNPDFELSYTNAPNFNPVATLTFTPNIDNNLTGTFYVRFKPSANGPASGTILVTAPDNSITTINTSGTGNLNPTITAAPISNILPAAPANVPSEQQAIVISGRNLVPATMSINLIGAHASDFEVSYSGGGSFSAMTLPNSANVNAGEINITVYVRRKAGAGIGNRTATLQLSAGVAIENVSLYNTVLPNPTQPITYVDQDWSGQLGVDTDLGSGVATWGVNAFSDIQQAINATNTGGTVFIYKGNLPYQYTNSILIYRPINLIGSIPADPNQAGTGINPPVIDGTLGIANASAIELMGNVSNVHIKGFVFQGYNNSGLAITNEGTSPNHNIVIKYNYFNNINGISDRAPIKNRLNPTGPSFGWEIGYNTLENFSGHGMILENLSGAQIVKNHFISINDPASAGIWLFANAATANLPILLNGNLILDNLFDDIQDAMGIVVTAQAVSSSSATIQNIMINGNNITGSGLPIKVFNNGGANTAIEDVSINGNTLNITDPTGHLGIDYVALRIYNTRGPLKIFENELSVSGNLNGAPFYSGILIEIEHPAPTLVEIRRNTLNGGLIPGNNAGKAIVFKKLTPTVNVQVSGNYFVDFATAISNQANVPALIDVYNNSLLFGGVAGIENNGGEIKANCNWWSSPSGPSIIVNAIIGSGNTITHTWMESDNDVMPAIPGFQGNGVCIGASSAILQELVDGTPINNKLVLTDGEYFAGNTLITQKITIEGNGTNTVIKPLDGSIINTYSPITPGNLFSNNYQHGFIINSDSVTIKNVVIDGDETIPCEQRFGAGIISNHTSADPDYTGIVIENVTIQNVYSVGIQLYNTGEGDTIINTTINNVCLKDDPGTLFPYAMGIYANQQAIIENNTISEAGTGIWLDQGAALGSNPMVLKNNTINSMESTGIKANLLPYNPSCNLSIEGNTIDGVGKYGIECWGLSQNCVIGGIDAGEPNLINVNSGITSHGPGAGILVADSRGAVIDSNIVNCNQVAQSGIILFRNAAVTANDTIQLLNVEITNTGTVTGGVFSDASTVNTSQGVGIFITEDGTLFGTTGGSSHMVIMDNVISGFKTGIHTNGILGTPHKVTARLGSNDDGTTGTSVTVHDCEIGLLVNGKSVTTSTNNARSFYNCVTAVKVWGADAYIESCAIYGNKYGIVVEDKVGGISEVQIFDNKIEGNTLNLDNKSTGIVAASRNWWGTPLDCGATIDGDNAVDFTPWFDNGNDLDGGDGFDGDRSIIHVAVQTAQVGGADTEINEGISLVNDGGTVLLHSTDFNEDVVVTKNVTLDAQFAPGNIVELDGIHINIPGGVLKLQNGTFNIADNLNLEDGKIELVGNANLVLLPGATVTKANNFDNNSYVVAEGTGLFIRQVPGANQDVWFHVGTNSAYLPATLNNNGGANGNYGLRLQDQLLTNGTTGAAYTDDVVGKTWFVEKQAGSGASNATLTLYWNEANELTGFDRTLAAIRKWDGVSWTNTPLSFLNRGNASGTIWFASAQNINAFSPFGVFEGSPALATCPDAPNAMPMSHTSCTPNTFAFDVTMGVNPGDFVSLYPANYQGFNYDFGNPPCGLPPCISNFTSGASTTFLPNPPAGGGNDRVRIGGGNIMRLITAGGFDGVTGFPQLGTGGSQIEIQAAPNTTANKFAIHDYNGGKSFYTKFNIIFAGGNNGQFFFLQGNGNSFSNNSLFMNSETFTGIRWTFGAFNAITTAYHNGTNWVNMTNPAPLPLQQTNLANVNNPLNQPVYTIEIHGNNDMIPLYYNKGGVTYSIASGRWDLWINGMLVGDELNKAQLPANTDIDSWMFYGVSSTSGPARIYLDDIAYSNGNALAIDATMPYQLTTPTVSTTTDFKITATNSTTGCESDPTTVNVTITPGVAQPIVSNANQSLCTPGSVIFSATMGTPAGNEMRLYDVATGGTPVASTTAGPTYNLASPSVATTTTFYIAAYSSMLMCESARVPVTLTIGGNVATPNVSNPTVTLCSSGTGTFLATMGTPAGTEMRLYNAATGGTLLSSTTTGPVFSLTSPSVAVTTTFYIAAAIGNCESPRVPVTVSLNSTIASPNIVNPLASVCGSGGAVFNATMGTPAGTEMRLYNVATGGTPIAVSNTGPTFSLLSPTVNTTTTFYIAAGTGTCESPRIPVTVDVGVLPQVANIPVTAISQCGSGTFTFTAQMQMPAGTEMRMYDAFSGGNLIATSTMGPNYQLTTPFLNNSQNFWVAAANACGESGRIMVSAVVASVPAAPTVANNNISVCNSGSVTFNVLAGSPAGTEMRLYDAAVGGNLLASNNNAPNFSLVTPSVSTTTNFWVAAANGNCEGTTRTMVTVTVNTAPAAPTVMNPNVSVCGSGSATFVATMNTPIGTIMRLYDAPIGGNLLASTTTGPNFSLTTPSVSAATTFYIAAANTCGESPRVPASISIAGVPGIPTPAVFNVSRCGTGNVTFTATMGNPAGTEMRLYTTSTGGSPVAVSTNGPTFSLVSTTVSTTTNFFIAAASGNCESPRVQVTAVVSPGLGTPTVAQSNIIYCGSAAVTFTAFMGNPAGIEMRLYDAPVGGNLLTNSAGPNFALTTPVLNGTLQNFWIAAGSGPNCESARVQVTATPSNNPPAIPTVQNTSVSVCGNGVGTFTATMNSPAGTEILLYNAPVGGTIVASSSIGPNFTVTTPGVSTTTTFYLTARLGANCESARVPVTVFVTPGSGVPFVAAPNLSRCGTGTLTFSAQMGNPAGSEMRLYTTQTGGTPVATTTVGPNYSLTTPTIATTTAFYIASATGNCESARTQVIATVLPLPAAPIFNNTTGSTCGASGVTFSAQMGTPAGVELRMYNAPVGGSVVASTNVGPTYNITTPPVFITTNFWVAAVSSAGCEGPRVQVTANVATSPSVSATSGNASCSQGGNISAIGVGGAGFGYSYSLDGVSFNNTTGIFTGLNAGSYTVTVKDANGCVGSTGVVVSGIAAPTILSSSVNGTNVTINWSSIATIANYQIWYRPIGNSSWQTISGITGTSATLTGLVAGTSYQVQVRGVCANGTTSAFSALANFTTANQSPVGSCATPIGLAATVTSPTTATATWIPNISGAVCYIISYGPSNTNPAIWPQFLVPHPGSSLQLSGLLPGVTYGMTIRTNCSLCSAVSGTRTPASQVVQFTTPANRAGEELSVDSTPTFSIYPNPNQGNFSLVLDAKQAGNALIDVVDMTGRSIITQSQVITTGHNAINFDLNGQAAGVYLLRFQQGEFVRLVKVIIQ